MARGHNEELSNYIRSRLTVVEPVGTPRLVHTKSLRVLRSVCVLDVGHFRNVLTGRTAATHEVIEKLRAAQDIN
jgi:hypothetical protein